MVGMFYPADHCILGGTSGSSWHACMWRYVCQVEDKFTRTKVDCGLIISQLIIQTDNHADNP